MQYFSHRMKCHFHGQRGTYIFCKSYSMLRKEESRRNTLKKHFIQHLLSLGMDKSKSNFIIECNVREQLNDYLIYNVKIIISYLN